MRIQVKFKREDLGQDIILNVKSILGTYKRYLIGKCEILNEIGEIVITENGGFRCECAIFYLNKTIEYKGRTFSEFKLPVDISNLLQSSLDEEIRVKGEERAAFLKSNEEKFNNVEVKIIDGNFGWDLGEYRDCTNGSMAETMLDIIHRAGISSRVKYKIYKFFVTFNDGAIYKINSNVLFDIVKTEYDIFKKNEEALEKEAL